MSNNLLDVERSLRYIAKRYKSVKFSVGLAIMFLMMGVGAFSADIKEENGTTVKTIENGTVGTESSQQTLNVLTRPEIGGSVESIRDKFKLIRAENDKALDGSLEQTTTMIIGDQHIREKEIKHKNILMKEYLKEVKILMKEIYHQIVQAMKNIQKKKEQQ